MHKSMVITIFLLLLPQILIAESSDLEIDPVEVSSGNYKVLLENGFIRVVEFQVNPGEKDNWHTHPAKVSYVVSGGSLKITTEEGNSFVVEEEANSARWFDAVGKHYGENVGLTPVRIVFVEIKGIEEVKEDLNQFNETRNLK